MRVKRQRSHILKAIAHTFRNYNVIIRQSIRRIKQRDCSNPYVTVTIMVTEGVCNVHISKMRFKI